MTRDEFIVKLGIEGPETPEVETMINELLDRVRREMNENVPHLNIEAGNINEVLNQLSELHSSISGFEDENGTLQRIQVSFDNTNGTIIRLNSNLQETIRFLNEEERQQLRNLDVAQRRLMIEEQHAYDESGELITDRRRVGSIAAVDTYQYETTVNYIENSNALLQEHSRIINQIISLNKKMEAAQRSGNEEYVVDLQNQIDLLAQRANEIQRNTDVQGKLNVFDVLSKTSNAQSDRGQKAYENILKYTKQIEDIRTKMISSSDLERDSLTLQIRELERKLNIERDIANLTQTQTNRVQEVENIASEQREIEELKRSLSEISVLYSQMANEQKKAFSAKEDSAEQEYYNQRISSIREAIDLREQEIQTSNRYASAQRELTNIQNNYNNVVAELNAKQSTKEDTKKIDEAIQKLKELTEARKNLINMKSKGVDTSEIEKTTQRINELEKELKQYTSEVVTNGKQVKETKEYTEAYEKSLQDLQSAQEKAANGAKDHTSVLGKLFGNLGQVISNVVKYNVAQIGLNETIDKTIGTMKELDAAMTNIRLVTGESEASARDMLNTYSDMAYELGTTTTAVAEGKILLSLNLLNCGKLLRALDTKLL